VSEDPVLQAMSELAAALRRFAVEADEVSTSFQRAARMRETGASHRDIAESDGALVGLMAGSLPAMLDALGQFRRRQARALYDEGLSMGKLGKLLRISRQRVAILISQQRALD